MCHFSLSFRELISGVFGTSECPPVLMEPSVGFVKNPQSGSRFVERGGALRPKRFLAVSGPADGQQQKHQVHHTFFIQYFQERGTPSAWVFSM